MDTSETVLGDQPFRVFILVDMNSAGAQQIVGQLSTPFEAVVEEMALPWSLTIGDALPASSCDLLLLFKKPFASVPKDYPFGAIGLIICDQADVFWDDLVKFDFVVSTSSEEFTQLVSRRNPQTFFLPEFEPKRLIEIGRDRIKRDSEGLDVLWHGGHYSKSELDAIIPIISKAFESIGTRATLWVVSGRQAPKIKSVGGLTVHELPWSEVNLIGAASRARLGLIPARASLKNSYLKPASRIRRLYAMGVPAVGDSRVPEVVRLSRRIGAPVFDFSAMRPSDFVHLWNDVEMLRRIARSGFRVVNDEHSERITVLRWISLFFRVSRG
jgi:hypothetical protein